MTKFTLVAVVRNEAPYILDWIAHHLALGVDDFVLCVHGSSDGTAKVTRRLAAIGYAAHLKIAVRDDDPVNSALEQISDLDEIEGADWIGLINLDQYLNIHVGHGGLEDLVGRAGADIDAFELTALSFGATDGAAASERRLTETCQWREDGGGSDRATVRIARTLEALRAPEGLMQIGTDLAQVNHYGCRSIDHLAMRLSTPLYQDEAQILEDWLAQNRADVSDETIRRYDRWVKKYSRFLRADRRLRLAQKAGVEWHASRAAACREDARLNRFLSQAET